MGSFSDRKRKKMDELMLLDWLFEEEKGELDAGWTFTTLVPITDVITQQMYLHWTQVC